MRILISNDDGVYAKGIEVLAQHLQAQTDYDVTVVAPDRQRSAMGHAITLHKPLRVDSADIGTDIKAFKVNGTPSDCVKLGMHAICDEVPDIVISGINSGSNLGTDVFYSGTVSAAAEAAMSGIPSIAISACGPEPFAYDQAAEFLSKFLSKYDLQTFHKYGMLNINIPKSSKPIQGVRTTILGRRVYSTTFVQREDPLGRTYYWLAGEELVVENDDDTDVAAIAAGFISVTPIHFSLTDNKWVSELTDSFWQQRGI